MKRLPGDIRIWTGRLSEADCPPHCWGASPHPTWSGPEQNRKGKGELTLPSCLSWDTRACAQTGIYTKGSWLAGFWLRLELNHGLPRASSLQTRDHGVSQPPYSSEPIPHNQSLSLSTYVCVCLYLCVYAHIHTLSVLVVLFGEPQYSILQLGRAEKLHLLYSDL